MVGRSLKSIKRRRTWATTLHVEHLSKLNVNIIRQFLNFFSMQPFPVINCNLYEFVFHVVMFHRSDTYNTTQQYQSTIPQCCTRQCVVHTLNHPRHRCPEHALGEEPASIRTSSTFSHSNNPGCPALSVRTTSFMVMF